MDTRSVDRDGGMGPTSGRPRRPGSRASAGRLGTARGARRAVALPGYSPITLQMKPIEMKKPREQGDQADAAVGRVRAGRAGTQLQADAEDHRPADEQQAPEPLAVRAR